MLLSGSPFAYSLTPVSQDNSQSSYFTVGRSHQLLLVENDNGKREEQRHKSGSLVLPLDSGKKEDKEGKKCMTVCTRWGQDCIIDPARGRKCRRMCKEFGEECF